MACFTGDEVPPVKLMEKSRHLPGNCPLPMVQEGQNETGDGPQNRDVGVVIKPLTHRRDEKSCSSLVCPILLTTPYT
jgi:hypothetical protein